MKDTLLSVYLEQLQQFLRKRHKGGKFNPMGDYHFNGTGHTSANLGTGDTNMTNLVINGTYHKALAKVFKNNQLSTLYLHLNWKSCNTPLRGNANQGELAEIFSNTIQAIKNSTNGPLD